MWTAKNYGILSLLCLLFAACKQEVKPAPAAAEVAELQDTLSSPAIAEKLAVHDGLHLRLAERVDKGKAESTNYKAFIEQLKYSNSQHTLVIPKAALGPCENCPPLDWNDYLLKQVLGTPQLMKEINGFRPQLGVKSENGKQWIFTRATDSLLVREQSGQLYLLWQTDIRASNGLLHILKPIDSLSN
ncbi:hypothetical protein [Gilvibacter sp.]|uniref:hypothetical protein n=1 Tax=Gilvibacter sp. TaxID=2729997 RepID=UPI0035BE3E40